MPSDLEERPLHPNAELSDRMCYRWRLARTPEAKGVFSCQANVDATTVVGNSELALVHLDADRQPRVLAVRTSPACAINAVVNQVKNGATQLDVLGEHV